MIQVTDTVQGVCAPRFERLRQLFAGKIESGEDLGASLAVTIDGEFVVDLWGGWADEARTQSWQADTITNVWSSTKTMTSLSALLLVDRGELDLDSPVARYWPEFSAAGKSNVKVRHVLSWTSGVSGWEQPMATADLYDWEKCTTLLAAQSLWWEPGTASGYHTVSYGFLVGELVRRVTGLKLGAFFKSEIAQPLQADFHIGLDPSEFSRVANLVPPPPFDLSALDPGSISFKSLCNPPLDPLAPRTSAWREADIGAANGHGNARSVARIQSLVASGGAVDGIRLLSTQTIDRIFQTQSQGIDLVLGIPLKMGVGYGLPVPGLMPHISTGRVCYWGGWGGSSVVVDVDRRMTITYMMNKMAADIAGGGIAAALVACAYACHEAA